MKKKLAIFVLSQFLLAGWADAQQAYFIDGYHGGIYGHYPVGQTAFIAQKLRQNPNWNINIEIEPESWEVVRQRDPEGYEAFKRLFKDQSVESGRIEYVNPTYAQSYFFGTSGESAIRQFEYGMRLIRKHFPEAVFTTYSAEEPCFTSCLPYILKSFGFSYASTKNPNTMWGGYVSAYGGELVNWVGPDGTRLTTVPRYACEDLQPGSCWQSISWFNTEDYIHKCLMPASSTRSACVSKTLHGAMAGIKALGWDRIRRAIIRRPPIRLGGITSKTVPSGLLRMIGISRKRMS